NDGAVALLLPAGRLGLEDDLDAHLLQLLRDDADALGVDAGQDRRQRLDDGDLAAELGIDRAELEADVAAADDHHALGQTREGQRAGRIDDALLVEREARDLDRRRAGGDDYALRLDPHRGAVVLLHLERVGPDEAGGALHERRLVGLEELPDAAGELPDDGLLP